MGESGLAVVPNKLIWRPATPWLTGASAQGKMTVMLSTDHQRGTLLGLAIGDALGAAVEFDEHGPGRQYGQRGLGPRRPGPPQYADDEE